MAQEVPAHLNVPSHLLSSYNARLQRWSSLILQHSIAKRLGSPGTGLPVPHPSGPCPDTLHGCFKAFKEVNIIEFWKVYIQFKCFTIDPNSVTKSCSVIKKPFDKRPGELWPSSLLPDRKSLQKVLKTPNTLWNFCYTCEVLDIQWTFTWEQIKTNWKITAATNLPNKIQNAWIADLRLFMSSDIVWTKIKPTH